ALDAIAPPVTLALGAVAAPSMRLRVPLAFAHAPLLSCVTGLGNSAAPLPTGCYRVPVVSTRTWSEKADAVFCSRRQPTCACRCGGTQNLRGAECSRIFWKVVGEVGLEPTKASA